MTFLVAVAAGAVGAACRYLVSGVVQGRSRSDFPAGTLAVNLTGAFLLGLLAGGTQLESTLAIAAIGFLGGFTTFSTWMIEIVRLGLPRVRSRAVAYLVASLVFGIVLAAAGYSLTH